jgi:hypothetical protein
MTDLDIVRAKVHTFSMGDVDDVEIYAAAPIWDWQQTDAGKWVMENAIEPPYWTHGNDFTRYSNDITIVAKFTAKDYTYWKLKYG